MAKTQAEWISDLTKANAKLRQKAFEHEKRIATIRKEVIDWLDCTGPYAPLAVDINEDYDKHFEKAMGNLLGFMWDPQTRKHLTGSQFFKVG